MKYVCKGCGIILTEEEAVRDPDDDVVCEACYLENKSNWFSNGEDKPADEFTASSDLQKRELSGAVDIKKPFWKRYL